MGKILVRVALTGVISYEDTWDRGEQVTADPLGMRCLHREWKWLARGSSRDREGCVGCSPGREDAEKVLGGRVVEPPGPERESVWVGSPGAAEAAGGPFPEERRVAAGPEHFWKPSRAAGGIEQR